MTKCSSVQSLSRVQLFVTPWTVACQASLSITNSWSLLRLMSMESMMPSDHLIFIWLRDCSKEVSGEARICRDFLQQRPGSWNIKGLLLIKESQTSQVRELSAFLCMGRCKSLDSLKSFLWYPPQLSGVGGQYPALSHLESPRVHCCGWGGCGGW